MAAGYMTPVRAATTDIEPIARVVELTPRMAERLLAANPRNRDYGSKNYVVIKRAIERGEWKLNGEAIKVTTEGLLLDGQHRCRAVVETGISIKTFLIEGLEPETQETMDTGKARTLADMLKIRGEVNVGSLAALILRFKVAEVANLQAALSRRGPAALTIREQLDWFEANPWVREYVAPGRMVARSTPLSGASAGVLMRVFDEIDREDSAYFWARLMDGIELSGTNPIYVLRRAYQNLAENVKGERNQKYLAALTIKAWNAYRAGDDISLLRFRTGGAKPEPFPEPK